RVRLPALRERLDDLPPLVERLLAGLGASAEQCAGLATPAFLAGLRRHSWPGHVRELRNVLESSLGLEQPAPGREPPAAGAPVGAFQEARARALAHFERGYLTALMKEHDGKVASAAEAAGLSRVYLYRLLGKYGLLRNP